MDFAIEKKMPEVIPVRPKPFMFLDIADVRVEIFNITVPKKLSGIKSFSSYKLKKFRFLDIGKKDSLKSGNFRVGVSEAIEGYKKYLEYKDRNLTFNPLQYKSRINYRLKTDLGYLEGSDL